VRYTMYEKIHEGVKRAFKLVDWQELYQKAVSHRRSYWDQDAIDCNRVRVNDIPVSKNMPNYKKHKGRFFKDNLIFQHVKWLVSMLSGSIVTYDLQSKTSHRSENEELLEAEVNLYSCLLDIPKQTAASLYDCFYTGMGYVRMYWDKLAVSIANETGVPVIKHVDSMKMYLDPNTQANDKSDMRHIFHVEKQHYKNLMAEYPKHAHDIENKKDSDGMVEVITVQYNVERLVECMWITDESQQPEKKWIIPLSEWESMRDSGQVLPEQCMLSVPFKQRKVFWYEAKFFPDIDCVIQAPEFVGERCSYHILHYAHNPKSAYSYGLAYFMMDLQEMSIIMLTTLTVQMLKYQNPKRVIRGGSLKDPEYMKKYGDQLGEVYETNPEWDAENPGKEPLYYLPMPEFPAGISMISNLIKERMENRSGVTPTMQGEPVYSQMSGVAAAQFMNAGKIYHKEEQIRYQQFLTEIGYDLMLQIAENRNFPHDVQHLGTDNQNEMVRVNDLENSPYVFEPERTLVFAEVVENIELINQLKRQQALEMYSMGLLADRDALEFSGLDNPDRLHEAAQRQKGVKQVLDFLGNNPDIMQQLQQLMSGQERG